MSELGVSKAKSEDDKQKIKYLNQGMIMGTILFIPNLVFEAFIGFLPATILNFVFIVCVSICYLINSRGKYNTARNFAFIGLDLILLTANFTEGTQTGNYLIYTSLILLFPILMKINDSIKEILFILIFTITCFLISICVCPTKGYLGLDNEQDAALMFKGSFVVSFGLTVILAYIIYIITRKKEAELILSKELAETNAKIKLQFLSNMSHELRTPLNGIIGTTNLLQLDEHSNKQGEQYELLQYSSQHMLHLVNDLLDFSKIDSGMIELEDRNFNFQSFIKNIYNSFAPQFEQKNLYFKLLLDEQDLNFLIKSDDLRLGQILNNLLSNALKFTNEGGVTLAVSLVVLEPNKISIQFDITDTGIGIKKENATKIFDSFIQADIETTRKYGGTGLGLTISKKLIEVFGSKLQVESEFEKGSRFYFAAVFNTAKISYEEKTELEIKFNDLAGMKILIAEDNKINMLIARKFLLKWNVNLTEANNGIEAIELCKIHTFDLVLLDLEMPEADGYIALSEIRKLHPNIPAIAFTATVLDNIEESLLQKGFTDYILKPFVPKDLNEKIFKQKKSK
jgi:signal transduction histidine kinase/CheY-like chemotaxis protein